jgi:hypothetical protein
MRHASQVIVAGLLAFSLAACAKSTQPLPNKNTNWLEHCESDDDCGSALECRCGTCTVVCESDSTCEIDDTRALCWHEQSTELLGQCDEAPSLDSICVPREMVGAEDVPFEEECRGPGSCARMIAEGIMIPTAIAIADERVYWLESATTDPEDGVIRKDGVLKSARHDGGDTVTLARELRPDVDLKLDSTHAYFTHRSAFFPAISRVPLRGGDVEPVYETSLGYIAGLELLDSDVLFINYSDFGNDFESSAIYAAPNDGSLYTNPLHVPTKPPALVVERLPGNALGIVERDRKLYWNDGASVRMFDTTSGAEITEIAHSSDLVPNDSASRAAYPVVSHDDHLFWLWSDGLEHGGVASVDLQNPDDVRRIEGPNVSPPNVLVADATHVYWFQIDEPSSRTTVVRTDRTTDETVALASFDDVEPGPMALSDDHVFIALSDLNAEPGRGYIMRFSK